MLLGQDEFGRYSKPNGSHSQEVGIRGGPLHHPAWFAGASVRIKELMPCAGTRSSLEKGLIDLKGQMTHSQTNTLTWLSV